MTRCLMAYSPQLRLFLDVSFNVAAKFDLSMFWVPIAGPLHAV